MGRAAYICAETDWLNLPMKIIAILLGPITVGIAFIYNLGATILLPFVMFYADIRSGKEVNKRNWAIGLTLYSAVLVGAIALALYLLV